VCGGLSGAAAARSGSAVARFDRESGAKRDEDSAGHVKVLEV